MRCNVESRIGVFGSAIGIVVLLAYAASPSASQTSRGNVPAAMLVVSAPDLPPATDEIVREIDDDATGECWLLERDSRHPGGPGRMVLVRHETTVRVSIQPGNEVRENGSHAAPELPAPIIRAGDRLTAEEHSAVVDATLEAIALGPAREGSEFRVRLSIGGRVVRAVAIAAGRATLVPDSGVRP
ncbi:MAG: hypothetical protein WAL75_07905 [Terracidiphilus sp.]